MKIRKKVEEQENLNNAEQGITLVALVVTIVVLLILAGVTINAVFNDSGIIKQAQQAQIKTNHSILSDSLELKILDKYVSDIKQGKDTDMTNYLISIGYMDENGIVDVQAVLGQKLSTGNGTNGTDIYSIREGTLYYKDKKAIEVKIKDLFEPGSGEIIGDETTPEDYFDFDPDTGTISLKGATYYWKMGEIGDLDISKIVIPTTYQGQKVRRIGYITYKNIKEVIIPEGVEIIGKEALAGIKITNIVLPSTITTIEYGAFSMCSELENINIPENVNTIGENAFYYTDKIANINIGSNAINLGMSAFYGWESSQTITIEFLSKPSGWDSNWKYNCNAKIIWQTK